MSDSLRTRRNSRAGIAVAGLAISVGALLVPAVSAQAAQPAPAPAAVVQASQVAAPVANSLDSKVTIINGSSGPMTVYMGAGVAPTVPTQVSTLKPGEQTSMQGWNSLPHGKDVQATIDYGDGWFGSDDRVTVAGENPAVGWPSLQVQGCDQRNLAVDDKVTQTVTVDVLTGGTKTHTLELSRGKDFSDAKNLIVNVIN